MKWQIHWSQDAVEELTELGLGDARLARRIAVCVRNFGRGERADLKKLAGGLRTWRLRLGDWRILMTLDGSDAYVEAVDNRRDAY